MTADSPNIPIVLVQPHQMVEERNHACNTFIVLSEKSNNGTWPEDQFFDVVDKLPARDKLIFIFRNFTAQEVNNDALRPFSKAVILLSSQSGDKFGTWKQRISAADSYDMENLAMFTPDTGFLPERPNNLFKIQARTLPIFIYLFFRKKLFFASI